MGFERREVACAKCGYRWKTKVWCREDGTADSSSWVVLCTACDRDRQARKYRSLAAHHEMKAHEIRAKRGLRLAKARKKREEAAAAAKRPPVTHACGGVIE